MGRALRLRRIPREIGGMVSGSGEAMVSLRSYENELVIFRAFISYRA